MAISNFLLKKFQKMEEMYAVINTATHLPYIECSPETYEDQVFLFTLAEKAKAMVEKYAEKGYAFSVVKIVKNQILMFLGSLYSYAVTAVVLTEEEPVTIELERLVKKPDIEKLKNEKIPKLNPELQLTAIYLLQETRRKIPLEKRTEEEKRLLGEMEEEMVMNLFKSRIIIAIDLTESGGKLDPEHPNFRLPFVKLPNGDTLVPVYTEFGEFKKFQIQTKSKINMSLMTVPYGDLKKFTKQAKGAVLNPSGCNLILTNELIDKLQKKYGE